MNRVSIVIPVYNRSDYLPRLFRSLEAITYDGFEVILVDNASTDNSLALCQQFALRSSISVKVVEESQPGASFARNKGLNECNTEWVYFFDSDDELSSDFLSILMPLTDDRDVVFLPTLQVCGEHSYIRPYKATDDAGYQILSSMLNSPSMLFRTSWLRGIGGWNASLTVWDDWELGVRVLLHKPRYVWYTEKAFHRLYVHEESITGPSMSHNLEGKLDCLLCVANQLKSLHHRKALFFRYILLEGYLKKEGYRVEKNSSLAICQREMHMNPWIQLCGRILVNYIRLGGRGAWRIACAV